MKKTLDEELNKQIVFTTSLFKADEEFTDERYMRVRIAVMHSGVNRNHSKFTKKVIEDAKDTFMNIPILANVVVDEDGNMDFHAHDMHIEQDAFDEESQKVIYDEKVVGIIPESNDFEMVYDKETKNYYAYVTGFLFRSYGNYVCEILENRNGITDVSAEIICDDISYNAKDRIVNVGKMCMSGVTLLGDTVTPGMNGAHATTFSENDENKQTQLIKIMQELKESLDNYTLAYANKNSKEGGNIVTKLEELLNKYSKTEEDITFEIDGLSDEELEQKFVEEFGETTTEEEDATENNEATESTSDEEGKSTDEATATESKENTDDNKDEDDEDNDDTENDDTENEVCGKKKKNNSLERVDTFSLSFNEISRALNNLISMHRTDDEWCYIEDVFDDNTFIMHDWDNNKYYKQAYSVDGDNIALSGERYAVFGVFVTAEEKKALEDMKKNYSSIEQELNTYKEKEVTEKKETLFKSKDYEGIVNTDDYKTLYNEMINYSVEELVTKLDLALAKSVKVGTFAFINKEQKTNAKLNRVNFANTLVKDKPSTNSFLEGLLNNK